MTEGISKERLLEIAANSNPDVALVINVLIQRECKELDHWLPIDENAPKDREILLIYPENETYTQRKAVGYWDGQYFETGIDSLYGEMPTHWQELPEDPKD
jgi:hypothetical protein